MKEYIGFCLFLTMMLKVPYPADITIHVFLIHTILPIFKIKTVRSC